MSLPKCNRSVISSANNYDIVLLQPHYVWIKVTVRRNFVEPFPVETAERVLSAGEQFLGEIGRKAIFNDGGGSLTDVVGDTNKF
jgi:hypothetical protein